MRTLLLDCNYFPVKIISWQKAMILYLSDRAEVVDEYSNFPIRTITRTFRLPKILRLYQTHKLSRNVKFSRLNVFFRDHFQCQYCSIKLPINELTFDHIIPVSKAGETTWENVVTCCKTCNTKKGPKSLKESGLKLFKTPKKPHWCPEMCLRLKNDDPLEWWDFFPNTSKRMVA